MRLSELNPAWLEKDGVQVGVMFDCPHCREVKLTCFWVGMKMWGEELPAPGHWEGQFGAIRRALDAQKLQGIKENNVVPCDPKCVWTRSGDTFETLSCTPSLDASKSGHWHGFITDGEIR